MVYLDYNASTPLDQRVMPLLAEACEVFANPASTHHRAGQMAAELIEEARSRVASLLARPARDVIFTSGATEAAVIGLVGAMLGRVDRPNVVVSSTEHKAVVAAAELGARLSGGEVRLAAVDRRGVVELSQLDDLVDDSVSAIAVMAANNETGVIGPVTEVADIAHRFGALTFVDATQLVGKGPLEDVMRCADIAVCSSHKIYGPKGAGALIANRRVQSNLVPIFAGGGQERGIRGGTQNTVAIAGFGLAAELVEKDQLGDVSRTAQLADRLLTTLRHHLGEVYVNGAGAQCIPNTLNLRFVGADAEAVMASMPNIFVSSGSACQSASPSPSHVLLAMGMTGTEAAESLRISLGRPTTSQEIDIAASAIIEAVSRVRDMTAA
ncbi:MULTISPECIES: cysteine desulfurase family protein [unclassified Mycobacterium]|uniref:cysteine desulfurase family protein n=1 Tax=unclassified Mycobacterium TaxID=2642494 RepID=UPI0007FCEA8B|nr:MULTISPECIES: cysteine desulfurase family protein [unclassified Mycobacterium]OBG78131.1 cysteine desulfurase [Mycobacterium sp. E1214]OBH30002.1 cysteine desulfurase [Mycobacterium sp. E1319]